MPKVLRMIRVGAAKQRRVTMTARHNQTSGIVALYLHFLNRVQAAQDGLLGAYTVWKQRNKRVHAAVTQRNSLT